MIDKYEMKEGVSHSDRIAVKGILKRLEALDSHFKMYHFAIIDFIDEEDELVREQAILDNHDDRIVELS